VLVVFDLNNKGSKSNPTTKRFPFARGQIPRSNVGYDVHAWPTPWVTSQTADTTRCALGPACWLRLGDRATMFPTAILTSPGPFNSRVQHSFPVPQCSYLPHWPWHQLRLAICDWMPAPYSLLHAESWGLEPGADTGGMQGMDAPTRPKQVLTWHSISLKIIAKNFCVLFIT